MRGTLACALALAAALTTAVQAQNAASVLAAASKAMGADGLNAITFSGTARNGTFGQSVAIGNPMHANNVTTVTAYTRTINFGQASEPTALVSRATGPTQPPATPDVPTPMPGVLNQNITQQQASTNWAQALNIWATPWGFLKAAAANNATVRQQGGQQIVSFSPASFKSPSGQTYTVTGYINNQNLVTKVETRVENAVVGDLLVEFEYSGYRNLNGLHVPGKIVQKQAGLTTSEITVMAATPNPGNLAELLTAPPAPARGGGPGGGGPGGPPGGGAPQQAAAPPVEKVGEGVYKIGGNYTSLAIDMGDHILVVESGGSDQRGQAVMAAAKQAIPGKPIRFVVNSHPHFDHAGGLQAAIAEGATILTHRNNEQGMERLMGGPRALGGDSLAKVTTRRTDVFQGVGDRDVRRGTNGKVVELHHLPNQHSDGMLLVYLPAERVIYTADVTVVDPTPAQRGVLRSAVQTINRLKLDYNGWIPAHPLNPDRPMTKTDVDAAAAAGN